MKEVYVDLDIDKLRDLAHKVAIKIDSGDIIAFFGGIGFGKTTFIRYLCEGLNVEDDVTSPTFSLMNEYSGKFKVYHYDMYRISSFDDLESIGFFDNLDKEALTVIEWSENVQDYLPQGTIYISIDLGSDENLRNVIIERSGI